MKKVENFFRALENLREIYQYNNPEGNVVITGLVGLYEICFEQSWKAMKEILEDSGFAERKTGSPKMVIRTAYSAELIQDEEVWLHALADRSNVTHAYNSEIAKAIIRHTKEEYVPMFDKLKATMEKDWLDG